MDAPMLLCTISTKWLFIATSTLVCIHQAPLKMVHPCASMRITTRNAAYHVWNTFLNFRSRVPRQCLGPGFKRRCAFEIALQGVGTIGTVFSTFWLNPDWSVVLHGCGLVRFVHSSLSLCCSETSNGQLCIVVLFCAVRPSLLLLFLPCFPHVSCGSRLMNRAFLLSGQEAKQRPFFGSGWG